MKELNKRKEGFIFINLVDFDMLYGHRNDVVGYAGALEEFDAWLPRLINILGEQDLLIITSDHGCDPTMPGTDHTREYALLLVYGAGIKAGIDLGIGGSLADAGQSIGVTIENDFDLKRGQVICGVQQPPQIQERIRSHIFWLSCERFNLGDCLRIKCGTFEEKCKIEQIIERMDSSTLQIIDGSSSNIDEMQVGKVVISIERPMVVEDFNTIQELGRFVLLRNNQVCAGGIITKQ